MGAGWCMVVVLGAGGEGVLARWWGSVVVHGGRAGCWGGGGAGWVVGLSGGAGWWCWVLGGGAGWWVVMLGGGAECWGFV